MRSILKNFIVFFAAFLIIAGFLSAFSSPFNSVEDASFGSVVESIKKGDVQSVVVEGDVLSVTYADATEKKSHKESGESLASLLGIYGVGVDDIAKVSIESKEPGGVILWIATLAPFLIPLLLIGFFIWFMMRQVQGANNRAMTFGQSTAREHRGDTPKHGKKTTFADVAGSTEAKQELEEVVEFLRQPQKFAKLGARIPRGVLLVGPPGTEKHCLPRLSPEKLVSRFSICLDLNLWKCLWVWALPVCAIYSKKQKRALLQLYLLMKWMLLDGSAVLV